MNIKENEFSGAPGGSSGTSNYGTGYGTYSSPNVSQNAASFDPLKLSTKAETDDLKRPKDSMQATGSIDAMVKDLYNGKKETPSPDEIITGMKYELGEMYPKDKAIAKEKVVMNLKTDPKYYSKLSMMNIDDDEMTPDVTTEIKKIFKELIEKKNSEFVVNANILEAYNESARVYGKR